MTKRFYLDANCLETRWPHLGGELSILLGLARLAGTDICIPQSVLVEHENSTIRRVRDSLVHATGALQSANSRLRGIHETLSFQELDEAHARTEYARAAAEVQKYYSVKIIPFPTLTIEDFVCRAACTTPPFKDEDRGLRDAVHLESAIEHLRNSAIEDAYFLTTDRFLLDSIQQHYPQLKAIGSFKEAIDAVREAIPTSSSRLFQHLGDIWSLPLFERARADLPPFFKSLIGKTIAFGRTFATVERTKFKLTGDRAQVGPATTDHVYPISLALSVEIFAYFSEPRMTPTGFQVSGGGIFDLFVTAEGDVVSNDQYQMREADFRSARVSAILHHRPNHLEELSEPLELIPG